MARSSESSRQLLKTCPADPQVYRPCAADVVAAVESLYADEVRPYGRILLKRLAERAISEASAAPFATVSHRNLAEWVPRIDAGRLRRVCERSRQLRVEGEDSGEYSALLVGRPQTFVDACHEVDVYAERMWLEAAAYFAGPGAQSLVLPGGRYACAQALLSLRLPFLAGLSLGRVCHVVQLAISRRRLLGYLSGQVVPYLCSEAVVKERCANKLQAAALGPRAVPALPLATLEQARACLWEMLSGEDGEPVDVPLPNVKRLFRSRFNLDLSETALGQSRLCELLQEPCFHDVCAVLPQGNGYAVVRAVRVCHRLSIDDFVAPLAPAPVQFEVLSTSPSAVRGAAQAPALPQFEARPTLLGRAAPQWAPPSAPPAHEAWETCGLQPTLETWATRGTPPTLEVWETCGLSPTLETWDGLSPSLETWETWEPWEAWGEFPVLCAPPAPPAPPAPRAPPPPAHLPGPPLLQQPCAQQPGGDAWEATCQALGMGPPPGASDSEATESTAEGPPESASLATPPRPAGRAGHAHESPAVQWPSEWAVGDVLEEEELSGPASEQPRAGLAAEPLGMESELTLLEPPASSPLILQGGHWSAFISPSVLAGDGCIGSMVKNTFIHLSPVGARGRRRAQSVPVDMGSARDAWEASCDTMLFRPAALPAARAEGGKD